MKITNKVLCGAMVISLSAIVYAQTPTATSSMPDETSGMMTHLPPSKKAIRSQNKALARQVEHVLRRTKGLEDSDIVAFAMAQTGEVILAGVISDQSEESIATEAATKVPGVKSVTSKLTMREVGN
jgi:hyperosmotically inducible periplasmic protein